MTRDLFSLSILLFILVGCWIHGESVWVPAGLILTLLGGLLVREYQARKREDFIQQLRSHRKQLQGGEAVLVDGMLLRYDSVLATYYLVIGSVFDTVIVPSSFHHSANEENSRGLLFALVTTLTGWWAFPRGPVYTICALHENLTGGERRTVGELIDRNPEILVELGQATTGDCTQGGSEAVTVSQQAVPERSRTVSEAFLAPDTTTIGAMLEAKFVEPFRRILSQRRGRIS